MLTRPTVAINLKMYVLNHHAVYLKLTHVIYQLYLSKARKGKKTLNVPKGELVNSFKYIRYIKIYTSFTVFLILG